MKNEILPSFFEITTFNFSVDKTNELFSSDLEKLIFSGVFLTTRDSFIGISDFVQWTVPEE